MQWMGLGNLWFALIIPAIIVLYLLKRKVEDRVIPSTLLWQRTMQNWEAVKPWERLRRNLLLLLQLLAACLLVLALIRPAVPTEGITTDHTILVVDTSGSMMTKEGNETRLERAVSQAKALVEKLGSGQTMTLIEAGREPNVLVSKSADKEPLLQAIEKLAPFSGTSDQIAALSLAGAIAENEPGSGVVWMGDGSGERKLDGGSVPAFSGSFQFMQMGSTRENTAIGVFVTQPTEKGVEGLLRVDNHGSMPAKGKVTVFDEHDKLLDTDSFEMGAGSSQTFSFQKLAMSSVYRAVIEPEQDGLSQDNVMWSVPFAAGRGKAALYSPEGNRFLHQVLQTVGSLEVETIQQAPDAVAAARDLWVFDGVVPDQLPKGNILLIAPNKKTEWLPLAGEKELDQQPRPVSPDDPLLKHVDWRDVHVAKGYALDEMPGMKPLVRAGDVDLVRAGIIDGRRMVIIGFDLHASDFPLRPAFPIFMQNVVNWLSPGQTAPIPTAHPGEVLTIPLSPGATTRTLTYPNGHQESLTEDSTSKTMQLPELTGLYRLDEGVDTGTKSTYFTVQMNEEESNITPKSVSVARKNAEEQKESEEATATDTTGALGTKELTYWLAAFALLVLLVEWRVYQRGY
ncbi:VWA domain-containing protein [Brevibacillus antibioticus]|uniref:VWA domain-containing protein n=1 Tax=Brevibacillus antibioticus TaxID=2570228 RepID=A0A4U2YFC7_9BACL|nr:VWA domain-containing protein [Brevibacillus antibioticus]TKI58862.1 VWA domain-containing protein [Brevibacillus antibioticus]